MDKQSLTRRHFLKAAAVAVPAGAVLVDTVRNTAAAQALPRLAVDDPAAKALLYVEDTTKVDKKNPAAARHTNDQKCSNCAQIQGKDGDAWRPCAIFPGKSVAADGWCSVWAKKA